MTEDTPTNDAPDSTSIAAYPELVPDGGLTNILIEPPIDSLNDSRKIVYMLLIENGAMTRPELQEYKSYSTAHESIDELKALGLVGERQRREDLQKTEYYPCAPGSA